MKVLVTFLVGSIISFNLFAQSEGLRYGARFGIGESRFTKESLSAQQGKLSFNTGLAANYQFFENFGLTLDALFVSKGTKAQGSVTRSTFTGTREIQFEETYRMFYAEIPLMAKASVGFNNFYLKAFAGPSLNFNLLSTYSRDYDDPDETDISDEQMKNLEVMEQTIVYGVGFEVEMADHELFFLDFRNSTGLSSFGKVTSTGEDGYSSYFSIGIGYMY